MSSELYKFQQATLAGISFAQEVKSMQEPLLDRITLNPHVMVGKPVIRGTRLTVEYILNVLAHGASIQEVLDEYDGLTVEDIQACFLFATKSSEN